MRRAAAILLLLTLWPAAAPAQTADEVARAEAHYEAGMAAFEAGDFATAATEFQHSYDLVPKPELLYNASFALAQRGDVAAAREIARDAVATALPADIDAKFRARLYGWDVVDRAQVPIEPVEPPERAPYGLPHVPDVVLREQQAAAARATNGARIAAYLTGGLGIAALATAGVLELRVQAVGRDLDDAASQGDLDRYTTLLERGRGLQNWGRVSIVAGASLLATSVVLWILSHKKKRF